MVTQTQLSLNPRLVKEADTLAEAGYDVTVLYAYWNAWGAKFDKIFLAEKKWQAILIGGDPEQKPVLYFFSRLLHNFALIVNRKSKGKLLADIAIVRSAYFLKRAAKKYKADLYIGHNLGALPAIAKAAKSNQKPYGFDAEDFHRNEISDDINDAGVRIRARLEEKYFPFLNYLSVSSPLIALAYTRLFPELNPEVVLNLFPADNRISQPQNNNNAPLKLLWFSQTIGRGRGLEEVMEALEAFDEWTFELHLLGYIDPSFKIYKKTGVYFHDPIPSAELINFASQFDIGLAVETGIPFNRNICLTNKIFTYIQAGLCVIASDTEAQISLLAHYPQIGKICKKRTPQALADVLLYYHQHRDELFKARLAAFEIAGAELNWGNESKKILDIVEHTLSQGE